MNGQGCQKFLSFLPEGNEEHPSLTDVQFWAETGKNNTVDTLKEIEGNNRITFRGIRVHSHIAIYYTIAIARTNSHLSLLQPYQYIRVFS